MIYVDHAKLGNERVELWGDNAFVRKSTSGSSVEIWSNHRRPVCTFYLIKCQPTSKCFTHSWKIGLEAICIAVWLSQ